MKKYVYISIGGALGAALRLYIKNIHIWNYHENIPLNTLLINVSGSFILALFLTFALEVMEVDADIRLGVSTGFIGAFTTFSTLCKETVLLIYAGDYFSAISYVTVSTMLGLSAAYFGIVLARELILKIVRSYDDSDQDDMDGESEA